MWIAIIILLVLMLSIFSYQHFRIRRLEYMVENGNIVSFDIDESRKILNMQSTEFYAKIEEKKVKTE